MNRTDRNRMGLISSIGLVLAIACALGFALAWTQARRDAAALREWQGTMLRHIQAARGGDTPVDPAQAFDAFDRIVATQRTAAATTPAPPPPADRTPPAADADSSNEITRLRRTQSTGTAAGDAQIIERDSRAAWTGWK